MGDGIVSRPLMSLQYLKLAVATELVTTGELPKAIY
jgi:hypothetical protein